ncbi:c-type cytochrome [Roseospira navarrensis]|uniref:C-type cytochrome n=1 Tax=Roseospira navarrensis TaxID=140058 RepID=A0A7X2D3V6_9PROT|nr:c-type cytochrome [Roseospira navarrensis]MQX37794.1 c-type cytochrome [Roseospira navarrensis]
MTTRILKTVTLAGALILGGAATASEPPTAAPALTPADLMTLMKTMPAGDAARGADLHDTYWCASCHGTDGVAWSENYPSVAGQARVYVYKTLLDYRDGRRVEGDGRWESMAATVRALDDQDLADLAAYYAGAVLPAPDAGTAQASAEAAPAVMTLVRHGDPSRLMTACASCHGVSGTGGKPEVPRLAGLERAYLERTLRLFHGGVRASDTDKNMRFFADRLSDDEIAALAAYYAGLE